jgi:hypothetical protein
VYLTTDRVDMFRDTVGAAEDERLDGSGLWTDQAQPLKRRTQ